MNDWLAQVAKDLQMNWEKEGDSSSWEVILEQIERRLMELEKEGRLSAILYQVDLNEFKLREDMDSGKWDSWWSLLAQRVAEREAIKVIFRYQYAGKW